MIIGTSSLEMLFCKKIYTLCDLFRRLRETFAALRQNVLGRVVKIELYVIKGIFLRRKYCLKDFYVFFIFFGH